MLFLGLKVVAVNMSDPFGDDAVDFPIEEMLESSFESAVDFGLMLFPSVGECTPGVVNVPVARSNADEIAAGEDPLSPPSFVAVPALSPVGRIVLIAVISLLASTVPSRRRAPGRV